MDINDKIIKCIENEEPIIFVKYADGEYNCIIKDYNNNYLEWSAGEGDMYTEQKKRGLINALRYFNDIPTAYIGKWHTTFITDYFQGICNKPIQFTKLHSLLFDNADVKTNFKEKIEICKAIQNSKMKKILLCNPLLIKAKSLLNIDVVIEIPLKNWYENSESVKKQILDNVKEDEKLLLITCAGIGSKIMISELHKILPNGIYLDYGSGLDLICTKKDSRGWDYKYEQLENAFRDILPTDWNDAKYNYIYEEARFQLGLHLPK
jgi:hypothetical protein